ncbi:sigma-70 family RNA polymerase sigma factor [Nocardioides albus]|uniref:RNA polymerase sigma-70 factor (ECF subfamily) n=1 Tax=Nocardioides albus TaxID=1841 RepID=A0A7W5F9V4_9ACTN|nr:sigma-70 family RNA polymerase sigma factor [Nocardioides albus]MBB3090608.1 RNA polymerase sigma-70 factor (ECF subfamily) [Nocardioides albus]GGU25124.1 DNA-directed RNA polymerase sigma-70 factor [Nocardioides albus]
MQQEWLAERFEDERRQLFGVAYRMLGSTTEAEDAVQESWVRLSRSDTDAIDNIGAWLTTVVARVSLNMLRSRKTRGEVSLDAGPFGAALPDPVVVLDDGATQDPAERAMLADSVSMALLVVLDQLSPDERLAFVLHDLFAVPFDEIATMLDRSSDSTRQLASRARRRVRGGTPQREVAAQREFVDAFFAAAQDGDLDRLIGALHPEVVLRADLGQGITTYRGAAKVAGNAVMYAHADRVTHPALVNGAAGVAVTFHGKLFSVMAFTVVDGRITEIEAYAAPTQVAKLAETLGLESAHS